MHTSPESDSDMSRRWRSRQYDRNDSRGLSASRLQHGGDGRIRVVARFNYQVTCFCFVNVVLLKVSKRFICML